MDITKRQMMILRQIIALYTASGDPVGSKLLSQLLEDFSVSAATLRNEMLEMTGLGLLEQPHTSAGRIPTNEGYRYYVNHLIVEKPLTPAEIKYIDQTTADMDFDPESAAEEAAAALANITGLAAITTSPTGGNIQITHYEVFQTGRFNLAVMGVTGVGGIKSRICRVAAELTEEQIHTVSRLLNEHLVFVSYEDTANCLATMQLLLDRAYALYEPVITAALSIIRSASDVKVFTEGTQNLLAYPEIDTNLKQLLELFSDKSDLLSFMRTDAPIQVFVGDEPGAFGLDRLSLVTGRYRAMGGREGSLAVAGPVRMDYGFVIPRLVRMRDRMSAALTNPTA